jgi:hypothetical protein
MHTTLRERLMEADRQRERQGVVWETLRRIAAELDQLEIPYAVVGRIALQHFGLQRSTEDVDVLVGSKRDLDTAHRNLLRRGYLRKSPKSRHLRDDVTRVRIAFLVGEYPGDGKPKPVQFPQPQRVSEASEDDLRFVNLKTLIELELASAMTAPQRIKDRADVLNLIHVLKLGADFAENLDPYVRDEFRALAPLPPPSEPE